MGKIIRINMKAKSASLEEIKMEYKLLGGRALTSRIIYDEVPADCDPLGEKNKLVIAPGLLGGTAVSSASRISVGCKSPLTNGIKESNSGGLVATYLAREGIKAIIIEGQPEDDKMYVIEIEKEKVNIIPADESLKNAGTYETTERLIKKYGKDAAIMCIGPAGENKMRAASIIVTDHNGELKFCARGGTGAVMGSKGVKAIVVKNSRGSITYFDREGFLNVARRVNKELMADPKTGDAYKKYGTAQIVNAVNAIGALPTKNFRFGAFEHASNLSGEKLYERVQERKGEGKTGVPCMPGCVIQCGNIYPDKEGNKIVSNLQYETIALVGSNLGFEDLDSVAKLNKEINDLGLDTIEMGCVLGVAIDAGLAKFGDEESCLALLNEIRKNSILGRVLGNGVEITGKVLGAKRIPEAKGQGIPGYDPRALKGNGVLYATSPMGADHTAGNAFGSRNEVNPLGREKQGDLSRNLQIRMTTLDSLGFCIFARGPLFKDTSTLTDMIYYLTGEKLTIDQVWEIGINTLKIEREFNIKAGVSPYRDKLNEFFYSEALPPTGATFDVPENEVEKAII
ncbi:aldehyde:ferredoxin oxidoreductase [Caldanaerovirga acetigignens]|uniref:Aldehyde:ferredoxin oxidoreductase n=1 Tax=Caldanaerovirga acetigignens TaxID=447595 RepID=A0A1M7I808_9FIRM|nr:aldehyde ferredoxin oxidoreductase C-terminal domain-containing protein [Caldanaerovirga acetigignens]SHM36835.1 aldehyde:ferredoxin oxidoreductase [Caldanaerovirga acetigignens]